MPSRTKTATKTDAWGANAAFDVMNCGTKAMKKHNALRVEQCDQE